jgi:hypothetical protein
MDHSIPGHQLAPIHRVEHSPLRICVLVSLELKQGASPFVLLRELPGARVYLGAVCDEERIQEWVEVWVQTLELRELAFSGYQERLSNHAFDQRWRAEGAALRKNIPNGLIVTWMEEENPDPIVVKRLSTDLTGTGFAATEPASWRICADDRLLESFGLPPYSTSTFRYLHEPAATDAKTFLATSADAPVNSHVQNLDRLSAAPDTHAVFNQHAGLVRVVRFYPLELENHLRILEGMPWESSALDASHLLPDSQYAALQAWSAKPKGLPFLLHGAANSSDRLNEIFFLKLSILREMFREVRACVKAHQMPLLNLSPASFRTGLAETGDQFPALWSAKCWLVKPSQAYPLKIKSTEQRYFIRLGRIEPSPFLPEGIGAHSFGIGSARIRNVTSEADGIILEGTLVAEDYLGLDPHDLLWFKLPLGEQKLEFYAHVYRDATGPKEARFRTVPARLSESVESSLKHVAGAIFPKSPYEIWPLLSSPCDMFSLGVIAVRVLLANDQSNLPVILDEILSLARRLGEEQSKKENFPVKLKSLLDSDERLAQLASPRAMIASNGSAQPKFKSVERELWLEAVTVLLRLFPGTGAQSYCKGFGDVSPLALEAVFDRPIQELETLILRLRSLLAPSLSANEEIAGVLLEQLASI